jgi:acetyltransferase-like isoleucine patch superfamily enzyme
VGSGTVIMPGVELGEGAAVGALSFVRRSVPAFKIVAGNPLRVLGDRGRELLDLERQYLAEGDVPARSG